MNWSEATLDLDSSVLHSQLPRYEMENDCLFFVLGLAHVAREYLQELESETPPHTGRPQDHPPVNAEIAPEDETLLHFLLGLRCFSLRLVDAAERLSYPPHASPPPQPTPRLILRDILR
jgi:hypothetical protein